MAEWAQVVLDPGVVSVSKDEIRLADLQPSPDLTPQIAAPQPPDGSTYTPPPPPTIRVRVTG